MIEEVVGEVRILGDLEVFFAEKGDAVEGDRRVEARGPLDVISHSFVGEGAGAEDDAVTWGVVIVAELIRGEVDFELTCCGDGVAGDEAELESFGRGGGAIEGAVELLGIGEAFFEMLAGDGSPFGARGGLREEGG